MYQTNCATQDMPGTYTNVTRESERLLQIAREMEKLAYEDEAFRDNPRFARLEVERRSVMLSLHTLTQA
jgi:hypothetical protein